jgi:hypothetical protein
MIAYKYALNNLEKTTALLSFVHLNVKHYLWKTAN